jgi:hypothetical protein
MGIFQQSAIVADVEGNSEIVAAIPILGLPILLHKYSFLLFEYISLLFYLYRVLGHARNSLSFLDNKCPLI